MTRYASERVINKTLEQLKRFSDINWKEPAYMTIIAKEGGAERELINELRKNIDHKEFGFIPINKLYNISLKLFNVKRNSREQYSLIKLYE